jgi:hypothetical protein
MTEASGADPGTEAAIELGMSVVGYEMTYGRQSDSTEPPQPPSSWISVEMWVKGAYIQRFGQQRPINRAIVFFSDQGLETTRVGNLWFQTTASAAAVNARAPYADFPGFWAALRLDRVARLSITVFPSTLDITTLQFMSQGSLFPLFGI